MLNVVLPLELETAVTAAARRSGLSVDDYLTAVCGDALMLEIDRSRVDSYLSGMAGISDDRARAWLAELSEGNRSECPR